MAKVTLLDFYADWCGPCIAMKPIMEEIEKEYSGKIEFKKINVDKEQASTQRYQVMSIPTLIFEKDDKIIDQITGHVDKKMIADKINELLK